jgi:hypothetical protein
MSFGGRFARMQARVNNEKILGNVRVGGLAESSYKPLREKMIAGARPLPPMPKRGYCESFAERGASDLTLPAGSLKGLVSSFLPAIAPRVFTSCGSF